MRIHKLIWSLLPGVSLLPGEVNAQNSPEPSLPNVIFIMADDIGYGDLGCYGATKIKTPAMDKLAGQGVRFTQAYAPAATSSPSRYALLTGEYAWRKGVSILPADAHLCIDKDTYTLPQMFKDANYTTGMVGKWHLGLGNMNSKVDFNTVIEPGPLSVGFDYAYYFPATNDRVPCIYIENEYVVGLSANQPIRISYSRNISSDPTGKEHPELLQMNELTGYHNGTIVNGVSRIGYMSGGEDARWNDETMAEHLLGKTIDFIKQNKSKPFFLYYAPHNAHEPRIPSVRFRGKSEAGIYGDVIEEFDYCIEQLIKTLKENGLYQNTILVITSDNGPMVKEGYNDGALENLNGHDPYNQLRGEKYSLHEGGTKVPFICSWPAHIKKGFTQEQPFTYLDMLATLARMTGICLSSQNSNDSRDASELFFHKEAKLYRDYILTQNNNSEVAIRCGDWKYIPAYGNKEDELYNLRNDRSELHNMKNVCPEIVEEMQIMVRSAYARNTAELKDELRKKWPGNRTVNLVFHGHSVPAGYHRTPQVETFDSYPYLTLKQLKEEYPYAVINSITTAIGGENSEQGYRRFREEVLAHKPDILFIDYALNDRAIGLERSLKAWEGMIREAQNKRIPVVLLTPTPDLSENILDEQTVLELHARQIRELAAKYRTGLIDSYAVFRKKAAEGEDLKAYMSQSNHPNEKGHEIVSSLLVKYLTDEK